MRQSTSRSNSSRSRAHPANAIFELMPEPTFRGTPATVPAVPTLLATRLQLELLLGSRSGSVDLREAAGIILNDLGATLEVFRLAGEECCEDAETSGVASRLEDCLASLGSDVWMDAVCANAVERIALTGDRLAELTSFWEHGRLLAYACWLLAEHSENVCPEEAYLVGLLHEAGHLPELLGWLPAQFGMQMGRPGCGELNACWDAQALRALAEHWRLPLYLKSLIAEPITASRWSGLLTAAHAWSRGEGAVLSHSA